MATDLLKLLALAQTASGAKYYARAFVAILCAILVWMLWNSESGFARVIAFIAFDAALAVGIWFFLQAPLEWSKYLVIKLAFLMLGAGRLLIKFALTGIAVILSVIYFLSPIDFIPDIIIGLGWIDDALIAFGMISYARSSQFNMPELRMSEQELAEHPAAKYWIVGLTSTLLTGLLRVLTA